MEDLEKPMITLFASILLGKLAASVDPLLPREHGWRLVSRGYVIPDRLIVKSLSISLSRFHGYYASCEGD